MENVLTTSDVAVRSLQELVRISPPTSFVFHNQDNKEMLKIHWGSDTIKVFIPGDVELDDAAERFFDYLKTFIFLGYDIVKKENV